jgi:hypothetical protein
MTEEQRKQLREALVAVEYGEFVRSPLDQVEHGKMTLAKVLDRLN